MEKDFDLIVIGGGISGSIVAKIAAKIGKKVALIEENSLGGGSLHTGSIPMSSMLSSAHLLFDARSKGKKYGLRTATIGYNFLAINNWCNYVKKELAVNHSKYQYKKLGIELFEGHGRFISPHEVSVNTKHLIGKKILIATGSRWQIDKIPGINDVNFFTPENIFNIKRIPKKIAIVGSGGRSLELADFFACIGTEVNVIFEGNKILRNEDSDINRYLLTRISKNKKIIFLSSSRIISLQKKGLLTQIDYLRANSKKVLKVDSLVFANKRTPNLDLGLENTTIDFSSDGIKVDNCFKTTAKNIYALGGCTNRSRLFRQSIMDGKIVANNICNRKQIALNKDINTPRTVMTSPRISSVGMNEDYCKQNNIKYKKATIVFDGNIIKSLINQDYGGFIKILTSRGGKILGCVVVGENTEGIIQEITLAIANGNTALDIAKLPHDNLGYSEAVRLACSQLI